MQRDPVKRKKSALHFFVSQAEVKMVLPWIFSGLGQSVYSPAQRRLLLPGHAVS